MGSCLCHGAFIPQNVLRQLRRWVGRRNNDCLFFSLCSASDQSSVVQQFKLKDFKMLLYSSQTVGIQFFIRIESCARVSGNGGNTGRNALPPLHLAKTGSAGFSSSLVFLGKQWERGM